MQTDKLKNVARIFKRAFWAHKYQIFFMVLAGFVSAFLEGIGINAIIPLFSLTLKGQNQPTDMISKYIEQFFAYFHIPYVLKYLLIMIGLLFAVKTVTSFLSAYITDNIRTKSIQETRSKLLRLTLGTDWSYLSKQKIGHLEKIIMNEVQSTYTAVFAYASSLIILFINALIYIAIAFNISPNVTFLTIGLGFVFFWGFKPLMDRVRKASYATAVAEKSVANHINESMIGMKTIKAMALEDKVVEKGNAFFNKFRHLEMKQSIVSILGFVISQPLSVFVICALFAYSYKLPNFSFVSFIVIVYAINRIFNYVQAAQGLIQNIHAQYPYMRDVIEYEDKALAHAEKTNKENGRISFEKEIEFKDVSFSYGNSVRALSNISLNIPKGSMVGIAGPSGGGKTTIVDSILTLIKPESGEILVDGKNLNSIPNKAWKRHIGYVSQDIFLMNDTIRNNIAFYDPSITETEIIEAAKKAHIWDTIKNKPYGLDTPVGERGMELSGGQRQRIALARVLARKADVLILDEATSALDNESEAAIKKAIDELRGEVTIIVIAHKPTTVVDVDKLFIVKDGKIAEEGAPSNLLADDKSYFHSVFYSGHTE